MMHKRAFFLLFFCLTVSAVSAADFFWEEPWQFSPRQGSFPVSAFSDNLSVVIWQEAVPNRDAHIAASGFINIHLAVKEPGKDWEQRGIIAGPYAYSGTEPSILSLVIDNSDRIIITAAASSVQTDILISEDMGRSFSRHLLNMGEESSVAPRIFVRADGGYLLFVTRGIAQSLAIHYARSDDAVNWSPFQLFVTEDNLTLNFLPTHSSFGQRDIVFFQSLITGLEAYASFQLFFKTSDNGGRTWSPSRLFTSFNNPIVHTEASPASFDNQRPHITRYGNNFLLVWERRFSIQPPQIYGVVIDHNGNMISSVERINTDEAYCNNPIGFIYQGNPIVVWFDNRLGNNRVIMAQRGVLGWENRQLSIGTMNNSFARPVVDSNDGVFIFWQSDIRGAGQIFKLEPKRHVESPRITAANFVPTIPNRSEIVRVAWNIPRDTVGILGFSWTWSQDPEVTPPQNVMFFNTGNVNDMNLELNADIDGQWYFSIMAHDFAGNWSAPSRVGYFRKTTPPPILTLAEPIVDENGFLASNSFTMYWQPSEDPFIAGYTWSLQFLGTNGQAQYTLLQAAAAPPSRIMGTNTSVRYINIDNGVWAFSVSAIDLAGNIGEPAVLTFRTNRFIPYTNVSFIDARQDEQGLVSIRIMGRGFVTDGRITSVVLVQDNQPDVEIPSSFNIVSDREISGLTFENLYEGTYRLRLQHSGRGWYTAASAITVGRTVTVKHGDFTQIWRPSWTINSRGKITINPFAVLAVMLLILSALGIYAATRGLVSIVAESTGIKKEAFAIITGGFMSTEEKRKITRVQKKGKGLRFKLASFTIALVLSAIIMISVPMYIIVTNSQRETLFQSLYDRSRVLLEGLASSTRAHLPQGDLGALELGFLPAQAAALPEARYVTITGFRPGSIHNDHVWATNDPDILSKIDTTEFRAGISRITDSITPHKEQLNIDLNNLAREAAGELARNIVQLTQEALGYALRTDPAGIQRLYDIQVTIRALELRLTEILTEIGGRIYSQPAFNNESIFRDRNRIFIFYKPVMFRQGADDNFLRGLVRLEVSVDSIMERILEEQLLYLRTILIIALIALLIGTLAAIIFSNMIIRPILKLANHVKIIRDTDDKAKLEGMDIRIKSKDEIAILGNTINDMTYGLVRAALAASDLSIGKEIQKKFIPLDLDSQGNKKTSGVKQTPNLDFFGYYEGAKGVSGDYFDYRDLDGRYYAIIKCDVAGKGIPAALIMIQVATMFLNYFKQWKPNAKGMKIEEVVYQINDFIETLAFKGRFAAFTLCLFDSETGIARFCNAGDNIVRYYDASEGRLKSITLPETPATGVLPNVLIESTGGYSVQTVTIDKGDILLLYTDGIEEAKRKFRSPDYKEIICKEGPVDTPHENHLCGQGDEELGPDRVEAIINAVMAREVYSLRKYHNPEGDDKELKFDFSSCEGKVEDVIMGMVSVEKMFRCYKPTNATEGYRVVVDKKVDEFLKNHFLQYRRYCAYTKELPENDESYMYYTHVKEDEQYDDLTILGIKRK